MLRFGRGRIEFLRMIIGRLDSKSSFPCCPLSSQADWNKNPKLQRVIFSRTCNWSAVQESYPRPRRPQATLSTRLDAPDPVQLEAVIHALLVQNVTALRLTISACEQVTGFFDASLHPDKRLDQRFALQQCRPILSGSWCVHGTATKCTVATQFVASLLRRARCAAM
jgi:hypothetical protein